MNYVALGDIAIDARSGFASGDSDADGVVQIRMNNVTTEGVLIWDKVRRVPRPKNLADLIAEPGDILFNATNSPELVGKSALFPGYDEPVTFSNHFIRLRFDAKRVVPGYVVRWLHEQWMRRTFDNMCKRWVNQASVGKNDLLSLSLPLPPLKDQERITEILDHADSLRRLRQHAIDRLNSLGQAIFNEMFGDPASNPKRWRSAELVTLITVGPQNGLYKPSSLYGEGAPILRIDAFYDGRVTKLDGLKRMSVNDEELTLYGLRPNDIVVNRVNSTEYLGKSAIIPGLAEPTVFESNIMRLRVDAKQIDPRYLISFLQTPFLKAQVRRRTKDAVNQSSINQQDVKSFVVRIPPLDLQLRFVERIQISEQLAQTLGTGFAKAALLFFALQHRAFRGEL